MNRQGITVFGVSAGALVVGALALLASASVAPMALAASQEEEDVRAAKARAALEEAVERQQAELIAVQELSARAIEEQVARAEKIASTVAARLAQVGVLSGQEGRGRVRVRAPRAVMRNFGVGGGGAASRVLARAEELELTDAQRDQIRAADKQHRRDAIERQAAMDLARLDLDDLMDGEATEMDLAAVESKLLEISRLEVADQVAGLRLRQSVHAVLTPGQRDELGEMGNVFVFGDGDFRWHEGGNFRFDAPGQDVMLELRERMPQIWHYRMRDGMSEGGLFFRHEHDEDEDDEDEEEGEGGEQISRRTTAGTTGPVITG